MDPLLLKLWTQCFEETEVLWLVALLPVKVHLQLGRSGELVLHHHLADTQGDEVRQL